MFRNLLDAVSDNLISGGAYTLIIKAVLVTFIITLVAWVISVALGGVFSYFMCYRRKTVTFISEALSFIFRSTPVLLMLLFFYYGVFGALHISATLIAALALGVYGSGHVAEIIMKAVRESEYWKDWSLRRRLKNAFFTAALPKAASDSLFPLKRLAIQILQWSTVAGYIGVNDLTEVMQQIGQRTMYPFFSIAFSIIMYITATLLIEWAFSLLQKRIDRSAEEENAADE